MPERKLPGISVHQVQADRESDIDPDSNDHAKIVGIDPVRKIGSDPRQQNRSKQRQMGRQILHQTFSTWTFPRMPAGLKTRITISTANAIASLKVDQRLPLTNVSTIPKIRPPNAAPGTFPIPPRTAATKAFSPGNTPISG